MSLPGLRPAVTLETEPSPKLIDSLTGELLAITRTEAKLVQQWDGKASATALSARVFMTGLDVEPWQVEQFFTRLERMGLLTNPVPIVPDFVPPKPGVEQLTDRVPAVRGDLVIARLMPSGEVLEVFEPKRERGFSLLDFEISLARLLDGKRTVNELVELASALGIHVTLETLRAFLQQLRAYGFIDPRVKDGTTTWPSRTPWMTDVRDHYRSALRLLREGKKDAARQEIDALLQLEPAHLEGTALKLRLETKLLQIDVAILHGPPTPTEVIRTGQFSALTPADERAAPLKTDAFAGFGFDGDHVTSTGLPPMPETLTSAANKRTLRKRLLIAAAVVVVLLLIRPVPTVRVVPCELEVVMVGVPRVTVVGTVIKSNVKPGDTVKAGSVLAQLEATEEVSVVDKQLAAIEKQLAALAPPKDVAKLNKARAAVKTAQAAVTALEKQKKSANKKTLPAIEKKLAPKAKALDNARAALEALAHDAARAPLLAEQKALKEKKAAGSAEKPVIDVLAPVDGVLLVDARGQLPEKLFATDSYGRIVAPEFKFVFKKPLETKAEDALFFFDDSMVPVKLDGNVPHLAVRPDLIGKKGKLEIPEGRTLWILSL